MRTASSKISTLDRAKEICEKWKAEGKNIVFTNGCFDILHIGHVDYLEKARLKGDKLIVAINTDLSIQNIKGPTRPIINEKSRVQVLASLESIDLIIPFGTETPLELIKLLKPNLLVKGDDYQKDCRQSMDPKYIVGSNEVISYGGKIDTIPLVKGFSTTAVIEKIKKED